MTEVTTVYYEYYVYEKQFLAGHERRTFDGKIVGCSKCVGYCKYDGHPGFITSDLREQHDCRNKGCIYYVPKPRKERKEKPMQPDFTTLIMQSALNFTSDYEGMKVTGVSVNSDGCTLRYVALSNDYPIPEIEQILSKELRMPIKMRKIDCDYDIAARLIFS